jgi:hypothetical protein
MRVLSGTVLSVSNLSRYITLVSCSSGTHCTLVMRCLVGLPLVTLSIFFPALGTLYRWYACAVTLTLPRFLYAVPVASWFFVVDSAGFPVYWRRWCIPLLQATDFVACSNGAPRSAKQYTDSETDDAMLRITVFWDVTLCSLAGECRCFGRIYCLHLQESWETFGFSKLLVLIYQKVQHHFREKKVILIIGTSKKSSVCLFFVVLHNTVLQFFFAVYFFETSK